MHERPYGKGWKENYRNGIKEEDWVKNSKWEINASGGLSSKGTIAGVSLFLDIPEGKCGSPASPFNAQIPFGLLYVIFDETSYTFCSIWHGSQPHGSFPFSSTLAYDSIYFTPSS